MTRTLARPTLPVALVAALALSACLDLSPGVIEQRSWALDATRPGESSAPAPDGPVLVVRQFRASAGLEGRGFLVREQDGGWERDFYDEHAVPPAARISDLCARWLDASGLFRAVLEPGTAVGPELVLDGRLVNLYLDTSEKDAPVAALELESVLSDADDGALVHLGRYAERVPSASTSAEDVVAAWDRALALALGALENELAAVLTARAAPGVEASAPR